MDRDYRFISKAETMGASCEKGGIHDLKRMIWKFVKFPS